MFKLDRILRYSKVAAAGLATVAALALTAVLAYGLGSGHGSERARWLPASKAKDALELMERIDPAYAQEFEPDEGQPVRLTRAKYEKWLEAQLDKPHGLLASRLPGPPLGGQQSQLAVARRVALAGELLAKAQIAQLPRERQVELSTTAVRLLKHTWDDRLGEVPDLAEDLYVATPVAAAAAASAAGSTTASAATAPNVHAATVSASAPMAPPQPAPAPVVLTTEAKPVHPRAVEILAAVRAFNKDASAAR